MAVIIRKIFTHNDGHWPRVILLIPVLALFLMGCDIGGTFNGFDYSSLPGSSGQSVQNITLSTTDCDFGTVTLGNQVSVILTISNTGSLPLNVTDIALTEGSDYQIDPTSGDNPLGGNSATIPPGEERTVGIRFSPTSEGYHTGGIAIDSNDPDAPGITVQLTGDGVTAPVPDISISPTSKDFGDVLPGDTNSATYALSNGGTADLNVSDISIDDTTNFTLDLSAGSTPCGTPAPVIAAGDSCTFDITFSPTHLGTIDGALSIASDDPDQSSLSSSLTGSGVAAPPTYSATLSWQAPSTNADGSPITDLAGYKIYYGTSSRQYTNSSDVGSNTTGTIQGLSAGTYYFAVTAYDSYGNESGYSNEVTKTFP